MTGSSPADRSGGRRNGGRRDEGRSAVYAAEQQLARLLDRAADFPVVEIAGSRIALPAERRFADLASVQRYVDAVLGQTWVRAAWPEAAARPVTVRARRGHARAHYEFDDAVLAIPVAGRDARWALRELVVLHEIAHHLGSPHDRGHGAAFVTRLLTVVDRVIGAEAAFAMRVLLADQRATR